MLPYFKCYITSFSAGRKAMSVSFTLFHNVSINVLFYNCIQREPLNMMLISIVIVMETRPQKS